MVGLFYSIRARPHTACVLVLKGRTLSDRKLLLAFPGVGSTPYTPSTALLTDQPSAVLGCFGAELHVISMTLCNLPC